jgi:hypothetical protein
MCHGENKSPYTLWVGSGDRSGGDSNDAEFIFQFGPELPPGDHFTVTMKQFNMPTGTGDSEVEGSAPVAYAPVAMIHVLGLGYEQNTSTDSGVDGAGENIVGVTTPATIVSALSLTLYNNGIKNSLSGPDIVPSISVARPRSGLYRVQIRTPSGLFITGPTKAAAGGGTEQLPLNDWIMCLEFTPVQV